MASLKKLPASKLGLIKTIANKKATLPQQLQAFLVNVFLSRNLANPKLDIAFSGGLDSSALLHMLYQVNKTLPFKLRAHHVNHGLSINANNWAIFCAETCAKLNIPLTISKVNVEKNGGLGLEAAAREARYQVLKQTDADFILLAHHQDDQAETFMLQLARGAGVKGLAGMGVTNDKLLRPLLDAPRSALESYATQYRLTWIEDESNANTQFDRNFMRHDILPKLAKQYPAIRQTISRSAQHMADANTLLDEIAAQDVAACLQGEVLNLQLLQQLSHVRIHNALRGWLAQNACNVPSAAQLQQITQQLLHAKSDAAVKIKVSDTHTLQRYRHHAYLLADTDKAPAINILWQGENTVDLPNGSRLLFSQKMGEGFALNHAPNIKLRIKNRVGGERFRPDIGRPSRHLKTILQTCEIPPWQRAYLPLIFMDDSLVIIPNIGVDAGFKARADEMGLIVNWQPV